ncbi:MULTISPECIES: DUF2798 domain-containing protein [Yersinia]|uniref:DUF2798 domain-containing protein n=1 Tax=Yersinia TaxID=629 RepID=UPI0016436D43|nr:MULTISPECIES: DUF2798 domain-containing protein [Yersinia]MDA5544368.1 DUF2798 domain-containing protein [Yersinia rochesterensis]UZM73382.1 DUF2798 domain-containing protein [Yersinia sp. SCPM-O-B-9106 (C-191)]
MEKKVRRKLLMLRLSIQFVIALVISLVMTAINYGLKGAFFQNWAKGFIVAFIIIPLALRLIPIIARGVRVVIGNRTPFVLRCVIAVCVSIMMEGLIALVVTFAQHGLTSGWPLVWATTVVKALPLGLLVGVTMTFIVQPRMQKLAASAPAN